MAANTAPAPSLKRTRRATTARVSWSNEMNRAILDYAKNCMQLGKAFEKPSAPDYYRKFLERAEGFENVTVDKIVQHMKGLKKTYTDALDWKNRTGQGILSDDPAGGPLTVEQEVQKRCKWFHEFDEILGDKAQFNPPAVHHSVLDFDDDDDDSDAERPTSASAGCENEPDNQDDQQTPKTTPKSPPSKRPRKSPIKNASAALESAMKMRVLSDDKRLQWEMETERRKEAEAKAKAEAELQYKKELLEFEKSKWKDEHELRQLGEKNKFEIEKLRVEKEFELQKLKYLHE